jgi:hypothetical protein
MYQKNFAPILDAARIVAISPHLVDETYDATPFVAERDYVRLWLSDIGHDGDDGSVRGRVFDAHFFVITRQPSEFNGGSTAIPPVSDFISSG